MEPGRLKSSDEQTVESRSSRGSFLRKIGTMMAIGLGVAVIPGNAFAQSGRCCPRECRTCTSGNPYECDGCGNTCCLCLDRTDPCFNTPCPCG